MMNLVSLALGGNQFSSRIPGLWKLRRLEKLDLSNSCLSGAIPSSSLGLKQLLMLNSSWNQLSGSVPDIFSAFTFLKVVCLADNYFSGKNPKSLGLSNNMVSANVPKTISRLQELNLSHNYLCGPLPSTKFPSSPFLGNDCLCGAPLPPCKV